MKALKNILLSCIFVCSVLTAILLFAAGNLLFIPNTGYRIFNDVLSQNSAADSIQVSAREITELKNKAKLLQNKLDRLTPGGVFLVINTSENSFKLYKKNQLLLKGLCSTGSFIHLEVDSTQSWIFETPKGILTVKSKIVDPVWRKPDWAFIEEGLPVPPANDASRFESGVLGDYALSLGNGYLIHGTLYQRLLGMPVTHGCVRLNDEDLNVVYHSMEVGSKVFIY